MTVKESGLFQINHDLFENMDWCEELIRNFVEKYSGDIKWISRRNILLDKRNVLFHLESK